jgi:hypothetical protein
LDDDDEVLENKNSCTMAGGEPTYLVMRGGNPGGMIFLTVGDKFKYKNIYTDLLRHNFIYGESKTLSKFIVFHSGVRHDKLGCVDRIIISRCFYIWRLKV